MNDAVLKPLDTSLIDEVHARQRDLPRACGGTWKGLVREIRHLESDHPEKVAHRRRARGKATE